MNFDKVEDKKPVSFLLITIIFLAGAVLALCSSIKIQTVMIGYQYNVLVILIIMELFTNLIVETKIMQYLATRLALRSHGNKRTILILFSLLMFAISPFINNITSVMVILPVIFVLLKAIDLDRHYICIFFANLLAISNTGGASSPIGDFPAIIIMTSGITTFLDYLIRAMPVFIMTTIVLVVFWSFHIKKGIDAQSQELAVKLLHARYKHITVDKHTLIPLCIIFVAMFFTWSFVPQNVIPPEIVAVLGYVLAAAVCVMQGKKIKIIIDFKGVLTIAGFLFMASIISSTGWLELLGNILQTNIHNPRTLLLVIMFITSLVSGLFSAGPAAAAMMPIIINLCNTTLAEQSHWVAIAYAGAICAGSSLFMWSATAGFILSNKIEEAKLGYQWGISSYLKFGITNYIIQILITMGTIAIIL